MRMTLGELQPVGGLRHRRCIRTYEGENLLFQREIVRLIADLEHLDRVVDLQHVQHGRLS